MMTRVLEPSYNFSGIEPQPISENITRVVLLLAAYILYTLWYGFAVLYFFEGIGITAKRAAIKKE